MIKANISIIKNLAQNKVLYEISFKQNVYSDKINDYILQLRNIERDVVSFNIYNKILIDNEKAIVILSRIHNSENFEVKEKTIDFNKQDNLLERYIGEAISQQLRNRFEKLVITNKGKDWFKAVDYDKKEKFGQLSLFKGFRFKIIFLKGQVGIIIDPKSKFYTDLTLRDLYDTGEKFSERYLEKLCPINDCEQKFNPFATCKHANPESFGIMDTNNKFEDRKPSDVGDLINYYSTQGCPTGILAKRLEDKSPVITHYFIGSDKPYFYPLELIRKSPKFDDADEKTEELSDEVIISPDERFIRIKEALEYFETLKEYDFPIILSEPLSIDSEYLISEKFEKPNYIINNLSVNDNPFEIIKNGKIFSLKKKIRIYVLLPHYVKDLVEKIKCFFDDFKRWYNCFIDFEFINLDKTHFNDLGQNDGDHILYLLLKEDNDAEINISSYLISKGCRIHDIHLSTLINERLYKKENIYAPIYHKLFPPFYLLDNNQKFEETIGIAKQSYKKEKLCTILRFKNNGVFIKGIYIKETSEQIISEKIQKFLDSLNQKGNLVLINGFLSSNLQNYLKNNSKINYINISDNSLVRLFRFSFDEPSRSGIPSGHGIFFNNNWFIITYDSYQGTQRSIKLDNTNLSFDDFKDIAQICFEQTKYHPGFINNSMKLPFPIHFARKTLKKLKNLNFNELEIDYPIYL